MTREIALHCMKAASELERELCEECPIYGQTGCDHCFEDALQYVIRMLEQKPTTKNDLGVDWESYKDIDGNSLDDLILEVLQNNFDCGNTYGYKVADEIIGLLPSVTPQELSWIPVAERLPQESKMFLVTLVDKEDDYVCIDVAWYAHPNDYSIEFGEWREVPTSEKVIAWMQLPEPYKGE